MATREEEDRTARKILAALLTAFWSVRRLLRPGRLLRGFAAPDADHALPAAVDAAWQTVAAPLQQTLTGVTVEAMAQGGGPTLDPWSDPVVAWARTQSATLIREITSQQQQAVRQLLTRVATGDLPYKAAAHALTQIVGLTARQEATVARYRAGLVAQAGPNRAVRGLTPDRIEDLTDRYRDRLIRQRATVIARTEALTALNHGQYVLWQQSALATDPTMVKRWVIAADERTCVPCQRLDGQTRRLTEPFAIRGQLVQHPPGHPQCRCTLVLVRARQRLVA